MPEPSSDPRRIIAVVVTFNRRDMVTRLVAALDAGSVVPDEVVVVDNASTRRHRGRPRGGWTPRRR